MRSDNALSRVEAKLAEGRISVPPSPERLIERDPRTSSPADAYDLLALAFLAAVVLIMCLTVKDYAISNDEQIQHRYGELIIAYYQSGFRLRDVFSLENLYLYGGLFDVIAVGLSHVFTTIDVYELRHVLCALTGVAGIAATGAAARLIAGPRAGLMAIVALTLCGAWYVAMFNPTTYIPFAAAMA